MDEYISPYDFKIARYVIFDIREVAPRDSRFITAARALYETVLIANQILPSNFSHISLIVVASKGFEYILNELPIGTADKSVVHIFRRIRQLLCFPNKESAFSQRGSFDFIMNSIVSKYRRSFGNERSTRMELSILTSHEEQGVVQEATSFLQRTDFLNLQKLTVILLTHSAVGDQLYDWDESSAPGQLLVCSLVGKEQSTRRFFKAWLVDKSRRWSLVMAQCEQWLVSVDLEEMLIDWRWSDADADRRRPPNKEAVEFFHRDDELRRCLEISRWIRAKGVPVNLLYGAPRRLLPSDNVHCTSSPEENRAHFAALWLWLKTEKLVALVRLVPYDKATDLFVLIPGDDRSLVMRRIAPRELWMPLIGAGRVASTADVDVDVDVGEDRRTQSKRRHYDDVHLACVQIPHLTDYDPHRFDAQVLPVLEQQLQEATATAAEAPPPQPPPPPPLQLRRAASASRK